MFLAVFSVLFSMGVNAETWNPSGPIALKDIDPDGHQKGIIFYAGINYGCNLMGTIYVNENDSSDAIIGALNLTGDVLGLCNAIIFDNLPYDIEGNQDGTVTIKNVEIFTVWRSCAGDLTGAFNQQTGVISFNDSELPVIGAGSNCTFTGEISTTPQASFTVP